MAKRKTKRKKASKKVKPTIKWFEGGVMTPWGLAKPAKKARRKTVRRGPVLGTLGRKDSGTAKSHKPLEVLEDRLKRLSSIVATRRKDRKKWA
jgi:hypothetical protein